MNIRIVWRALLVLLLDALSLLLLSALLSGFVLDGALAALGAAAAIGLLNALIWPVLARIALPLTVLTLGGAALLLNGVLVTFAVNLLPGAHLDGVLEGIVVAVAMTALTAGSSRRCWRSTRTRSGTAASCAAERRRKRARGRATSRASSSSRSTGSPTTSCAARCRPATRPTLARWIDDGTHRLERWETDWSSQTGACQAGLLHGNNDDMPAFRWWEKDRGAAIVTNHPRDAAELERRHSDGRGLLHADGASRANILSGDAPHSMLTMSTVLERRGSLGQRLRDVLRPALRDRPHVDLDRRRGLPRAPCGAAPAPPRRAPADRAPLRAYALVRAYATVVQLDLQVAAVVGDMLAGRPVVYTTFLAYDEVAHHSGIQRPDTLDVLRRRRPPIARIDRAARRRAAALPARRAVRPRPVAGRRRSATATARRSRIWSLGRDRRARRELGQRPGRRAGVHERRADRGRGRDERRGAHGAHRDPRPADDGAVTLARGHAPGVDRRPRGEVPELSVMASGCLGLISFPREPGRVTLERIEELLPAS